MILLNLIRTEFINKEIKLYKYKISSNYYPSFSTYSYNIKNTEFLGETKGEIIDILDGSDQQKGLLLRFRVKIEGEKEIQDVYMWNIYQNIDKL